MLDKRFPTIALLLVLSTLAGAASAAADQWSPIRFMIGTWQGTAEGEPGKGAVSRKYEFILNNQFIRESNTSTYAPNEKNKTGEVHEHLSFFSFDKSRKSIVLRQFHEEGFVNQFTLNVTSVTAKKIVFESERFENFSNDWKARETYEIVGPDEFIETFELAPPGKPFEVYSKTRLRRATN